MPETPRFLDRLLALGGGRDGEARLLEREARREEVAAAGPALPLAGEQPQRPAVPARRQRLGLQPRRIVQESLAAKVLHDWLQNRHQTLFPMTLNFASLDPRSRGLVVQAMAVSATADGETDAEERRRLAGALEAAGAGEAERRLLDEALAAPPPLDPLLRALQEARLGAHAYAASLLALDRRSRVNAAWLDYLAARLGLPAEVVGGLNRRHRSPGGVGGGRLRPAPR